MSFFPGFSRSPLLALFAGLALSTTGRLTADAPPATFCNPINIDYGPYGDRGARHGADPVIVPFQGKYYLFDSWDHPGYRVSDDLIHWHTVLFDATRKDEPCEATRCFLSVILSLSKDQFSFPPGAPEAELILRLRSG